MPYLLTFIALVILAVLLWKAFGPTATPVPTRRRIIGPDDDPDFLWTVDRDARRKQAEGPDSPPADPPN